MTPFKKASAGRTIDTTELVGQFVTTWSSRMRSKQAGKPLFVMDDTPINDADLGSDTALLPLVIWHAETMYRYGIKDSGFGTAFRPSAEALLQRRVDLNRVHRSTSELLCFTLEALEDIRAHLPRSDKVPVATELRALVNHFATAMGLTSEVTSVPGVGSLAKPQG